MFLNKIIVVCLLVTVAKAQYNATNTTLRTDDFIAANKRIFENNIKDYDLRLQAFEESYLGRIKTIDTQLDLLIESLQEADQHLFTLQLLSNVNRECVNKNKMLLPRTQATVALCEACSSPAKQKLNSLLTGPRTTRNALKSYYDTTLDKNINACAKNVFETCVVNEINKAQLFTIKNQKTFESEMDAANCSADISVKQALQCSYQVQSDTTSLIANTIAFTDRCIQGLDCTFSSSHYCENVQFMPSYMIDRNSQTMRNPFYRSKEDVHCVLLNIGN